MLALALPVLLALAAPPVAAPAAAPRDPAQEELAAALASLGRDRHQPRAAADLARLSLLEDDAPELSRLDRAYAELAADPRALPEVRLLARAGRARLARAGGRLDAARAQERRLGLLTRFAVIGPFDGEGKRGDAQAFPPEAAIDLAARYPGKVREVGWRALPPEAAAGGFVHLGAALRPAREAVAYALAVVELPREARVRLSLGASGAARVFVNGALALADPAYHAARPGQRAALLTLRAGPNRILVKLAHDEGRMGFYLGLTTPRGDPLHFSERAPDPLPPLSAGAPPRPEPVASAADLLAARAERARGADEGRARLDLALVLADSRSADARERRAQAEARRAAALLPGSVEAQLLAARLEEDPNRRRERLEAALAADPGDPRPPRELGELELARHRAPDAVKLLERAVAAAPGDVRALSLLADAREACGLAAQADLLRLELAARFPRLPAAQAAAARAARRLDRTAEAIRLERAVLALRRDDGLARAALVQLLVDRGDVAGALAALEEAERFDPSDLAVRLRRGDLLAGSGRLAEAEAAYGAAERIAPEDPEPPERRGRARLQAGEAREALADLQRALELKPQNPELKELVRAVSPERERFERPYLQDAAALARAFDPARWKGEDAVVLGELQATRVYPSGLSSTYHQVVVKVLTRRGAEALRRHAIGFAPERQEVKVDRVRVVKPDGSAVETWQESERSASEPWYRLYYDTRTRTVTLPALEPGDLVELGWRLDDVAGENLLSDYFGDLVYLQDGYPKLRSEYVLLVPSARRIYANDPGVPGLERTERALPGGVTEHRFAARDLPRLDPEPAMPGYTEVGPFLHVSTYASWDDVARFYWGLVRDQLRPTDEVRATARRLEAEVKRERRARGLPEAGDERAVIEAVHDFVVTGTRYVGLEFGIHGYKPYRVDQVLSRRFGDCKDKASLTHALLEALGIDARLVLLRMSRLGNVPAAPASLAVFNHAISYVPRYDLWLDGTASWSGSRELPSEDRGATVLVVGPDGPPRFGRIPEGRAEENLTVLALDAELRPDGSAALSGDSTVGGGRAPEYRRAYGAEADRKVSFEQAWSRTFPGLSVKTVSLSDLSRLEQDVSMRFTLEVPHLAQRDGDGLAFAPFGEPSPYTEAYAPLSARAFPLVLGDPWENRFRYRYRLPAGWSAAALPEPVKLEAPFGAFEVTWREEQGALVVEGRVAFRVSRVAVADYPAFRGFTAAVDRAMARRVRVAPRQAAR
ncbi:DUF3857 domain-containing protein [Anaeromyxobacter paludicola]|nr:DUF3857 domain-containing protein [Anaeromyxobacter paludicola]